MAGLAQLVGVGHALVDDGGKLLGRHGGQLRFVEIDQAEVFHGGGLLVRIDDPFVR